MEKIGIITFFKSYNYGVWLQAYATQKFLIKNGFDTEIINYTNKHDDKKLRYIYKEGNSKKGYVTSFFKSLLFGKVRYYNKGFKRYLHRFYNLSDQHFTDVKDMESLKYDCIIAGSDQIWNPQITDGKLDEGFLLRFGNIKKRISYASSIGSSRVREQDREVFKQAFKKFDAISVREEFAAVELQKFTDKHIAVVCDPTFLLNKNEWIEFSRQNAVMQLSNIKYILTYFVSSDKYTDRYTNLVKSYSKAFNLPVYSIQFSSYYSSGCDKKILGASIADFIKLIDNAEIIITDSFHGVSLSLNLQKNFVSLENRSNPTRVRNLLGNLGIEERIDMDIMRYKQIEYKNVVPRLEKMRLDSAEWLLNAIKNE